MNKYLRSILIPERIQFDQFWVELRKRNRWLIIIRYGSVILLTVLLLVAIFFQKFFTDLSMNTTPLWIIAGTILVYNFFFHWYWVSQAKYDDAAHDENNIVFSMVQIILDMLALLLFIYFTGGVETPLFAFFIFHVIIGSLFLPGKVIVYLVTGVLLISISGAILELNGVIPHHGIDGLLSSPLYDVTNYLILFFGFFSTTLYLSIYLANSVAKDLIKGQRELTIANNELEEAEKSKSKYVLTVVHDLKTPIAAAISYIDMLLEGSLGEMKNEHIRPLERSKIRLNYALVTINDILHISKLKLKPTFENLKPVNLVELIWDIKNELKVFIDAKNITFSFRQGGKELFIDAEEQLIKHAISNIVTNAYKYTDEGGKIVIKLTDLCDFAEISIADNGIGIPENDKNKIFDDFYRTSISKKKKIEGTGLGMTIVKQVVQRYNGEIIVNSPSYIYSADSGGPGSEFIMKIPKKCNK